MSQNDKDIDKNAEKAEAEATAVTEAKDEESKAAAEGEDEESKAAAEGEDVADKESEESEAEKAEESEAEAETEKAEEVAAADESEGSEAEEAEDSEAEEAEDSEAEEAEDSEAKQAAESEDEDAEKAETAESEDAGEEAAADKSEPQELYGLLAEFQSPGDLVAAAAKVRDAGFTEWDCYSPFPVHGLDPAMGIQRTILPWIVFSVGLCGLGGGLLLQWWTNAYNWPWLVSGKPFFSLPANIPVTFETTILSSVFAAFFGMWILNKLPQVWHPLFKQQRFLKVTDDSFFIAVQASDKKFQRGKAETLLQEAGAVAVEPCYTSADPNRRKLPKSLAAFILVTVVLALVPFALIAKTRHSTSREPHIHIFPDMDFQPKYKAQRASSLFDNQRASRLPVKGTVARGRLKADEHFYRGIAGDKWATTFPSTFGVSNRMMKRGQERFGIYCQPCHGSSGKGDGIVQERAKRLAPNNKAGWVQPTNLHQDYVVKMPHGQLFNTISNGIRTMPSYGAQIPETDRWAIVLYIRALQRSQNATFSDVPPDERKDVR